MSPRWLTRVIMRRAACNTCLCICCLRPHNVSPPWPTPSTFTPAIWPPASVSSPIPSMTSLPPAPTPPRLPLPAKLSEPTKTAIRGRTHIAGRHHHPPLTISATITTITTTCCKQTRNTARSDKNLKNFGEPRTAGRYIRILV